jgi:Putative glutamine amidotransferase
LGERRVLFLGEGPRPGYLDGVLQTSFDLARVFGSQTVAEAGARLDEQRLFILSDYPSARLSAAEQGRLVDLVEREGRGLLMIGGWASFGGPRGSYHGSRLAELLPVDLMPADDRVNTPLGTVLLPRRMTHPAIATVQGQEPCVVVGYNDVRAREGADVLVEGYHLRIAEPPASPGAWIVTTAAGRHVSSRGLQSAPRRPRLERAPAPMLTVWARGAGRVGALAPDVSPHWAGGIVDWGLERVTLPTGSEVGHLYRAFLIDLCRWLMGAT